MSPRVAESSEHRRDFGLDEADGARFLALELVEGEDLSARLARGAIPVDEAIAFSRLGTDGSFDLWRRRVDGSVDEPLLVTPANESAPAPAPDDGLIAYVFNETGRDEIFVFDPEVQGSNLRLTTNGGGAPQWSRDARSLFYQQRTVMMRVRRLDGARVAFGEPERLFSFEDTALSPYMRRWAVFPDGEGFVALRDVSAGDKRAILTVVTNWTSEFDARR